MQQAGAGDQEYNCTVSDRADRLGQWYLGVSCPPLLCVLSGDRDAEVGGQQPAQHQSGEENSAPAMANSKNPEVNIQSKFDSFR